MSNLTSRQLDALDRIEQNPALQPFFFKKVKGLKWFDELEKRGFFNPELNPRPIKSDKEGYFSIPSWPILEYLEQTAPELQQPENFDYAERILKVMRDVTRSAIKDDVSNYRTWWYFAKIINFIPVEKITSDDVELLEYWLKDSFDHMLVGTELGNHLLPHLLASDSDHAYDLAVSLANALTVLTWNPKRWGNSGELEAALPVEAYHSRKIFSTHARAIGEKLEEKGVNIFRDRLSEIFCKSDKDKYSTIWRPAIEDHEQNKGRDNAEDILISALRDAILGYVDRHAAAAANYVGELLAGETVIFQRVAIYVADVCNRQLGELVKQLFDPQYFEYHYRHEMYHLLQNCFSVLDKKDKQKVLGIIESIAKQSKDPEQPKDIQEKKQDYIWLGWLSAIRGKGCQLADDLYTDKLEITKAEPEHPDFSIYMEVGWGKVLSPYSVEELLSRDFDELLNILKSFREEDGRKTPTRRGLAQTTKEALKTMPEFFEGHLTELIGLDYYYTYYLIEGYKELWKEKQYDNWTELFEFCWALLKSEGFWLKDAAEQRGGSAASSSWIVDAISELIEAGTVDDKTALDPVMLPMAGRIIVYILEHQEGENFTEERDAVSIAVSSPRGKCVEALIKYALLLCRLADKSDKGHGELWVRKLQPIFDKQIDLVQEGNFEFVTLFTKYLPNLLYLSRSWTLKQLPTIFEKEHRLRWLCAVQGYIYANRIYAADVYKFLRENGHLQDALDAKELEPEYKDNIIQNIAIAYYGGGEKLYGAEGTINWLVGRWKQEELQQLIWSIWTLRDNKVDVKEKLIPLWEEISSWADSNHREFDKRVASRLCMWSVFVDELNEQTMNLLLRAVSYAGLELENNAYILIKELKRLVEPYPDQVADIFIRMLDVFAPIYEQEDIEYVIDKLYCKGGDVRQKANTICDRYVKYGIGFPAEIRAKYSGRAG